MAKRRYPFHPRPHSRMKVPGARVQDARGSRTGVVVERSTVMAKVQWDDDPEASWTRVNDLKAV